MSAELVHYLDRYLSHWEVGGNDSNYFPWNDPDGGELRIVMALRKVLAETDHADVQEIVRDIFTAPGANDNVKIE